MKGKYLYAVIKKEDNQSLSFDGLTTVAYQGLAAVVEEKEVKDYHKLPKEETVVELISHQQIIENIMSQTPLLPVKFGTILKDEEEVKAVLEKGYFFLHNTLREVEDKIELDLVCFWNEAKAAQMAYQKSKRVRSLQGKTTKKKDATSEDKIALGKLVADYLASRREKLRNQILKTLKKEAVESCSHALADVNMLLNQAFLVKKKKQEAFNHALNKLDSRFADLLNFRLVGPLPPYSFSTILFKRISPKEVEKAKKTLGLNGEITDKLLNHAYRQLAQVHHPDKQSLRPDGLKQSLRPAKAGLKNASQGQLKFDLINSAYRVLKDFTKGGFFNVDIYHWEGGR